MANSSLALWKFLEFPPPPPTFLILDWLNPKMQNMGIYRSVIHLTGKELHLLTLPTRISQSAPHRPSAHIPPSLPPSLPPFLPSFLPETWSADLAQRCCSISPHGSSDSGLTELTGPGIVKGPGQPARTPPWKGCPREAPANHCKCPPKALRCVSSVVFEA